MNDNPFNVLGEQSSPPQLGEAISSVAEGPLRERIQSLIASSDIVLFMKGTPDYPQCGFSANTIGMLNHMGKPFKTFDILSNSEVRQGLKEYSHWPTYPQLYVKGELVGGNDILQEMFQKGELQKLIGSL